MKPKITQVTRGGKLNKQDFIEILETWMDLYACTGISSPSNNSVKTGLMKVASSLYVLEELRNTPVAYRINKAKLMAVNGESIDEISLLISEAVLILSK